MPDLNQLASSYEAAARESDAVIVQRLDDLLARLRNYARAIAHRRSGRMATTLYLDGPVRRAGRVEGAVKAAVSYAEIEVAHGGNHDYASRTVQESAGLIEASAADMGAAIVRKIGGVS